MVSVRNFFDVLVMLALGVLDHGVNRRELFGAFGTAEMFGFLMMMKDDFIFKGLLAIEAKRPQAGHISAFSTHLKNLLYI